MAGHIKSFISYIDDGEGSKEPALCIVTRGVTRGSRMVQIGLSKAWAYTADTYLIKKAKEFAVHLELGDSWFETRNVADTIINGLDMLCEAEEYEMVKDDRIKKPVSNGNEVKISSGGQVIFHEEIA
jgi:hypothetical protein